MIVLYVLLIWALIGVICIKKNETRYNKISDELYGIDYKTLVVMATGVNISGTTPQKTIDASYKVGLVVNSLIMGGLILLKSSVIATTYIRILGERAKLN